ncbi:hypothetical protein STCU_04364 [Strigomonas culicis]|uniref:Mitochondrial pyruvate carrier n=1 Tax=Strigomonas culicis TaxID=28005 RepID=S9VDX7_9TRYP|nr:hypothetical protein STCU_06772 [Strigomonas culicis]EPY29657.1 hypothetical protein STCU_04364 [Strigomonas culicis]|eukprot:EPY25241.1 hypothetical protein STCU_06772 [Strigomonas culicis]
MSATQQVIPKALPKVFHKYVGNPVLFKCLVPYEKYAVVKYINSAYNSAPLFKWSLSIVPLCGIMSGYPPVEQLDMNSSAALAATGLVWTFYACVIQPQNSGSRALALVNGCLFMVNGYNTYRSWAYQRSKKAAVVTEK